MAHNLDKFTDGGFIRWIAYDSQGKAFRCHRQQGGAEWRAYPSHLASDSDPRRFYARTLKALAAMVGESDSRTPGERAYIEDVRRCPLHHDGTPRRQWADIDPIARLSWERSPTPRTYGKAA